MQIADRTKIHTAENTGEGITVVYYAGGNSIANYMIATVVVTGKVKVGFITIPDRVPGCALQINIRSLFEVVAVEVTDIFSTTIDITVDSFAAIDVIRQRLQIGGGTDKPRVVLRAAAPAQKFIGGG